MAHEHLQRAALSLLGASGPRGAGHHRSPFRGSALPRVLHDLLPGLRESLPGACRVCHIVA